jgi:hypothetical protein
MKSEARNNTTHGAHGANGAASNAPTPPENDAPLELEPDVEDEHPGYGWAWNQAAARQAHEERQLERQTTAEREAVHRAAEEERLHGSSLNGSAADDTVTDHVQAPSLPSGMGAEAGHMSDMLRWALDSIHEPALAAADWLARDIDPDQPTATALLSNPSITLEQVKQAKSVFKTMRIVGEKSADRRVGARMYAAAIAAALVRHNEFITSQSDDALRRAFQGLLDDKRMPAALRDLAGMALCALAEKAKNRGQNRRRGAERLSAAEPPAPAPEAIRMPKAMPRPQPRRKGA